jgi:aryl-phospho-beta-D-glucosidase BglC (GH1 family)
MMQESGGAAYRDDPHASNDIPMSNLGAASKNQLYAAPRAKTKKKGFMIAVIIGVIVVIAIAVAVPVYFVVIRPKMLGTSGGGGAGSTASGATSGPGKPQNAVAKSGGDGSKVTTDDGKTFTYSNKFQGYWVSDPDNPFDNSAQAQSYTPPLNQTWKYGTDRIYGVNIGGWLNLEPFISPALYQRYPGVAVDEWTLSVAMAADTANGGLNQIEDHYKTFITEEDFAQIAGAGLNWVRIPIPFWIIEKYPEEPFLEKAGWKYFLKAIGWARKYGLRINIDLHALPGSQNGWNHSGRLGTIGFLSGVMGWANAQRGLDYIRIIAEFVSQPQYKDVIPFFGITNEAGVGEGDNQIPRTAISQYYYEAHQIIRSITGYGDGPMISIHDGFDALDKFAGFLSGSDRIALDTHPYFAFAGASADPPSAFLTRPCTTWAPPIVQSMNDFGFTAAGEFSLAINDCGTYVNGVGLGSRYEGDFSGGKTTPVGSCKEWNDYTTWTDQRKADYKQFMMSSQDALQNWFFWTWKIGISTLTNSIEAPMWSYSLGLKEGYIPADPREAEGQCARVGAPFEKFAGPFKPYQTGGAGAGQISAAQLALYGIWPPTAIGGQKNLAILPQYTATGPIPTLPVPTYYKPNSKDTFDAGSGWTSAKDTTPMSVPITGCTYPPIWDSATAAVPAQCALASFPPATIAKRSPHPRPSR